MYKMEDKNIKTRDLIRLEGIITALLNQMKTTYEAMEDVSGKYSYEESSDKDKEIMDRVENLLDELNKLWRY